jgi:hypothetical protein
LIKTTIKKTLSIMPSFIFSRKQKNVRTFFELLEIYSNNDYSFEKLIYYFDKNFEFNSIKTFKNYYKNIILQIDDILKYLNLEIIKYNPDFKLVEINPDEKFFKLKIKILFSLIKEIFDLLHKNKITNVLLDYEMYPFFCFLIFKISNIIILKPPNISHKYGF